MKATGILQWSLFVFMICPLTMQIGWADNQPQDDAWRAQATPGEIQFVETVKALYDEYDQLHTAMDKLGDPAKERAYFLANNPARNFVPRLLEIEKNNRGTALGLLACRKVIHLAAGGGLDSPSTAGRREVLKQLPHYVADPLCVEVIRYLDSGNPEPAVIEALQVQIQNEKAIPLVRDTCRLVLARYSLGESAGREYRERRLKELKDGGKPKYHFEKEDLSESLAKYPDWKTIRKREAEAVKLLKQLIAENADHRLPLVVGIDPDWCLIRLADKPNTNPRLAEMADGMLFKELHLKIRKPAPDLTVSLLEGQEWSLSMQRGRVVVIQFSFKGCGPCEAMYPDLRELNQTYAKDLAILSIMADQNKEDSIKAVESGKVTWDVTWDGYRGTINTRWGVQGYPTVYVIDRQGHVAGYGLRAESLKEKIAELVSAANSNSTP